MVAFLRNCASGCCTNIANKERHVAELTKQNILHNFKV